MLIQHRAAPEHPTAASTPGVRLFTQHDHGLLSGALTQGWAAHTLSSSCQLAIALHDACWRAVDELEPVAMCGAHLGALPFDAEVGMMHDFQTLPGAYKYPMYRAGIDELEALDPYAGLLLSHHFSAFIPASNAAFREHESTRRARLAAALGLAAPDTPSVLADFALLKFFDVLSLHICLAAPGARLDLVPGWLRSPFTLDGVAYALRWHDDSTMSLDPFPYRAPLEIQIPFRALDVSSFRTHSALLAAVRAAPVQRWTLRVVSPDAC